MFSPHRAKAAAATAARPKTIAKPQFNCCVRRDKLNNFSLIYHRVLTCTSLNLSLWERVLPGCRCWVSRSAKDYELLFCKCSRMAQCPPLNAFTAWTNKQPAEFLLPALQLRSGQIGVQRWRSCWWRWDQGCLITNPTTRSENRCGVREAI